MLQRLADRQEARERLEQFILAMPEFPIYREANGHYGIYVAGELQEFNSEEDALLGQLIARSDWLLQQHNERAKMTYANESHGESQQKLQLQQAEDEVLLYQNGRNDRGCPLHFQSGEDGVERFGEIIANLSPDLRVAFFRERYWASLQALNDLGN